MGFAFFLISYGAATIFRGPGWGTPPSSDSEMLSKNMPAYCAPIAYLTVDSGVLTHYLGDGKRDPVDGKRVFCSMTLEKTAGRLIEDGKEKCPRFNIWNKPDLPGKRYVKCKSNSGTFNRYMSLGDTEEATVGFNSQGSLDSMLFTYGDRKKEYNRATNQWDPATRQG